MKFHPRFDQILLQILEKDPQGYIVLLGNEGGVRAAIMRRLRASAAALAERVIWVSSQPRSRYLALIRCFDVMLDPYPFGGGNTVLEAFAVSMPVVTLPPKYARGRLCYAFYRQLGFTDLVAKDEAEYVSLALRLTQQPEFRQHAVQQIEARRDRLFQRDEAILQFGNLLAESHRYALARDASAAR